MSFVRRRPQSAFPSLVLIIALVPWWLGTLYSLGEAAATAEEAPLVRQTIDGQPFDAARESRARAHRSIQSWLTWKRTKVEQTVFTSYDSSTGAPYPSTWYLFDDFVEALEIMGVLGAGQQGDETLFFLGKDESEFMSGLVNVAAFLAHGMALSIRYDACDEFHEDIITGKYALSNSCGQFGRSYQDETCVGDEETMSCSVDPDADITAVTTLNSQIPPPPLQCQPKESAESFTTYWNPNAGGFFSEEDRPFANRAGRIDLEGCCWWGRGILMTRGTCNFGMVDNFLGRRAASRGFNNFFDVDFCAFPEVVCLGDHKSLRWVVGLFEWAVRIQSYSTPEWEYVTELNKFVESDFANAAEFIDAVGRVFTFGCHQEDCAIAEDQFNEEVRQNFVQLVNVVLELPQSVSPSSSPTAFPTRKPTSRPTMPSFGGDASERKPTPPPSVSPTDFPTMSPTQQPTEQPTEGPTTRPLKLTLPPRKKAPTGVPTPNPPTPNKSTLNPTNFPTYDFGIVVEIPSGGSTIYVFGSAWSIVLVIVIAYGAL